MTIAARLQELGIRLPKAAPPVANYVPWVIDGSSVYLSGQLPMTVEGIACTGRAGDVVDIPQATAAARQCAINLLAQIQAALGDLDRVTQVLKLGVFVASAPDFFDQPKVANGASDLMVQVFGPAGRHARSAVGVPCLPLGATVEVDAIIAFRV